MRESSIFAGGIFLTIGFTILIVACYIVLIRWVLKINKMERLQQQQVDLLTAIAKMQGVDTEVLNTILYRGKR